MLKTKCEAPTSPEEDLKLPHETARPTRRMIRASMAPRRTHMGFQISGAAPWSLLKVSRAYSIFTRVMDEVVASTASEMLTEATDLMTSMTSTRVPPAL